MKLYPVWPNVWYDSYSEILGDDVEFEEPEVDTRKYEMIPDISRANAMKIKARMKKLEGRYKKLSAIKKKKPKDDDD